MQDLARLHLQNCKKNGLKVVGITGSNGKTTTKELVKSVLAQEFSTYATLGNLNNHIGVPLSLLALKHETWAVIEMGANHIGEIAELCTFAEPDYGIITNIGAAHLEGFGGKLGVRQAKNELYLFLQQKNGKAIVNLDDETLKDLSKNMNYLGFSTQKIAHQVQIEVQKTEAGEPIILRYQYQNFISDWIKTQLIGFYNIANLAYALTLGVELGLNFEKIKKGLENYHPENSRSQWLKTANRTLIIDCYNANPDSMKAALESFAPLKTPKLAILGDMLELGSEAEVAHQQICQQVLALNIEAFLVGEIFTKSLENIAINEKIKLFSDKKKLMDYLETHQISQKTILLKASRGMDLNTLIPILS